MVATLFDTNVLSELMRKAPEQSVASFFVTCADPLVSVIVFHELIFGVEKLEDEVRKAKMMARIESFRDHFRERIIAIDARIAELSGRLRATAFRLGGALTPLDSLIAASALSRAANLATRNTKDFRQLGIPLVDPWHS